MKISVMELKYFFMRVLFEWYCTLDNSDEHSFVDFIGYFFRDFFFFFFSL